MNDQTIAQAIETAAPQAPRITPADIQANIVSEHYFTAKNGVDGALQEETGFTEALGMPESLSLLTFCVLVLRNGFTVTGESACVSPENFNAEIGRMVARRNAEAKIWPLMGYELRSKLQGTT
jgi:hypothetical protein